MMEVAKYALSSKVPSASRVGVGAAAWRSGLDRSAIRFSTGDGSRCAARDAGADVTLITGPTALVRPAGVRTFEVESADDMKDAILANLPRADAVIMAAAVADYRPVERVTSKLKKKDLGNEMTVRMTENPDLLKAIVAARRPGTVVVGFKAETGDATAEASRMLRDKKLDLVVANDVAGPGSPFGSDDDQVAFVSADGVERLPLLKKTEVARRLVSKLAERLAR